MSVCWPTFRGGGKGQINSWCHSSVVNGLTTKIRLDLSFILGLLQVLPVFIDTSFNHISGAIDNDAFDTPGNLILTYQKPSHDRGGMQSWQQLSQRELLMVLGANSTDVAPDIVTWIVKDEEALPHWRCAL